MGVLSNVHFRIVHQDCWRAKHAVVVCAPSLFLQSRESVVAGQLLIGKQRRQYV